MDHQIEVVTRRSEYRLGKARARAHIVEGLLKAIDMLDAVIAAIRASDDRPAARDALDGRAVLVLARSRPIHILDMTLGRLTRLGRSELEEEMAKLRATIAELEAILGDPGQAARPSSPRSSARSGPSTPTPAGPQITHDPGEMGVEDLIERRGDRRHHDPGRLHQGRAGGVVPHPGPRRARRPGGPAQGGGPGRRSGPHHHPTPTSCSSPTVVGSTACGPTRCP